jgi:hypothetical protein
MPSNILQQLSKNADDTQSLPPVENWNPEHCGQIDLTITANGDWVHEGSPITRKRLVKLFSRVLRKDEREYVLVTPVEKVTISVEWQPFVIIDFERQTDNDKSYYLMVDNCDNQVKLSHPEQLQFSEFQGQQLPIVHIRRNLFASFSRNCYYRLIEQAKQQQVNGKEALTIDSAGQIFNLGYLDPDSFQQ